MVNRSQASYKTIPKRGQVMLLALCRSIEPIAYSSVSPYLFFMVRDFGYDDPAKISSLCTFILMSFALGQTLSANIWSHWIADVFGRKFALLAGGLGVLIFSVLFGFSQSVTMAITCRFLAGFLNGNVALLRTIVGEIVAKDKKHQSHAFTVLPIAMNIGNIAGPMLTGMLVNVKISEKFPYLVPNLVAAPMILLSLVANFLFIEETLHSDSPRIIFSKRRDYGLAMGRAIERWWCRDYKLIEDNEDDFSDYQEEDQVTTLEYDLPDQLDRSGTRNEPHQLDAMASALTLPVLTALVCYAIMYTHGSFYLQLFPLFLSTPSVDHARFHFVKFNGGAGLDSFDIGVMLSIVGVVTVLLQLVVYPWASRKYGHAKLHQIALFGFLVYAIVPYLSYVTDEVAAIVICSMLACGPAFGSAFGATPLEIILTNVSPPGKLAVVNGYAQMSYSLARTVGPVVFGNIFALGVDIGVVGLVWWTMTAIAVVQLLLSIKLVKL